MTRIELLRSLIDATARARQLAPLLASYPWDSQDELVILSVDHVRSVLIRYLSGSMSSKELEEWADLIECRDDIGFASNSAKCIGEIIHSLANPAIMSEIDEELVRGFLENLKRRNPVRLLKN
jgi:hypothetical protein